MSSSSLSIGRLERRFSTGKTEDLQFGAGVNLLVGPPNTGKTKWLQTLDFLLGDPGANPFEGAEEGGLADKYDAAGVELVIGEERLWIERRWREVGAKSKVFVDDQEMAARDFQHFLMQKLGIPLLNFPKGNPMSGQTWPELSFRMLLRHIYRQQRFWGGIADQQPEGEQHACLLQFLGLAEHLFTEEYGQLVRLKMMAEQLKARRDHYRQTLDELARDVLSTPGVSLGVSVATIREAEDRLYREIEELRQRRTELIAGARDKVFSPEHRGRVEQMGEERAAFVVGLEELRHRSKATAERLEEMRRYRTEVMDEVDRMARAEDAGALLADLKITHCPACDQPISNVATDPGHCFLCHKMLPDEPMIEELGAVRLQFERQRLMGELTEANELLAVLQREAKHLAKDISIAEERLRMLENELAPARQAVGALIQDEVSAIDMALGELNERQRQLGRISAALELGQELTDRIAAIEREIEPLEVHVEEAARATDFGAAAGQLEDGMNAYLTAINQVKTGVWRHNLVRVEVSRYSFSIRVGVRRWQAALGGTDTLYLLMAYHYGLLTLSDKSERHYPGLSIIDVPGEFSGEAVEDKENFIVQPFVSLLSKEEYKGAQLIITGASFAGLADVHRINLSHVYVA
jgi:predicted  nucleic acid-binding Zn-ribbon protein